MAVHQVTDISHYANYLRQNPATGDTKERLRKIASFGERLHRLKEIEQREALSKVTYENALDVFASRIVKNADDREGLERYAQGVETALRGLKP